MTDGSALNSGLPNRQSGANVPCWIFTMFRPIKISVDFPALDKLLAYLEGQQQAEIDALTTQVSGLTLRLQQSQARQQAAVNKGK